MSTIGLYVPGRSVVHRLPAGVKLLVLLVAATAGVFVTEPVVVATTLVCVLALYPVSGLPWRTTFAQLRPALWFIVPLLVFHTVVSSWAHAVVVVGTLTALVLLAALVSLTTRVTALCDVVVRVAVPLKRFGVDPERVGLLVSLGVRAVPVMVGLAQEVRDAQRARGASASPTACMVPLVVRSLRHADRLTEALVARGVED